jgi:hypothetical protein
MDDRSTHQLCCIYDCIFADKDKPWFLGIFASLTKSETINNQYCFLVQAFGGPELYREKKGRYARLVGCHANYKIRTAVARRWMEHMEGAIHNHKNLVALEYMRDDQLSSGTQVDGGRIW